MKEFDDVINYTGKDRVTVDVSFLISVLTKAIRYDIMRQVANSGGYSAFANDADKAILGLDMGEKDDTVRD